jgi:REP element-mobilizing transposase RayT
MSSFKQILYHLIIKPYKREKVFTQKQRDRLYKYISVVSKNINCPIFAINGIEDHIHILVTIKPSMSLSDYIKKIKISSSIFIKENNVFPFFTKWAEGYSIFTCRMSDKATVINYINGQEEHHKKKSLHDEIHDLLEESGYFSSTLPEGQG